jgi:5-methylthioadenosine/S-adenosylhomocysteine deaminase
LGSWNLIKARWILPITAPPIPQGGILIKGERIERVLTEEEIKAFPRHQIWELPYHILLPGLINAHTHLELTCLANTPWEDKTSFTTWIKELVTTVRGWQEEDFIRSIKKGIQELIRNGIIAVGDISTTGLSLPLLSESGLAGIVYHEILGFSPQVLIERIESLKKKLEAYPSHEILASGISPHSPFTLSPQLLKEAYNLARERNLPLSIHLSETKEEVDFLLGDGKEIINLLKSLQAWDDYWQPPRTTPVKYLAQLETLSGIVGVHMNLVNEAEIKLLKTHEVKGIFCPKSNVWFCRPNTHPLPKLLSNNILVALGTDSLASNNSLNLFEEMRQVKSFFPEISNQTLLEMATINGAQVLGLADRIGSLTPGKEACLIAVEMEEAHYDPIDYIIEKADKPSFIIINGCLV